MAGILIGFGLVAFLLPGIYLAVRFALFSAAVMVGGAGPLEALSESWSRTHGHATTVFGFLAALFVPTVLLFLGILYVVSGGQPTRPVDTPTIRLLAGLLAVPMSTLHAGGITAMYAWFQPRPA